MPSKIRRTLTIGHDPITGEPIKKNFCGPTKKAVQAAIDKYKIEASERILQECADQHDPRCGYAEILQRQTTSFPVHGQQASDHG